MPRTWMRIPEPNMALSTDANAVDGARPWAHGYPSSPAPLHFFIEFFSRLVCSFLYVCMYFFALQQLFASVVRSMVQQNTHKIVSPCPSRLVAFFQTRWRIRNALHLLLYRALCFICMEMLLLVRSVSLCHFGSFGSSLLSTNGMFIV